MTLLDSWLVSHLINTLWFVQFVSFGMQNMLFTVLHVVFKVCAITLNKSWQKLITVFSFLHPNHLLRSGENDVEYSSNMELEEGDLMEDAAAAATPGASGMKNSLQNPRVRKVLLDSVPCSFWKQHQAACSAGISILGNAASCGFYWLLQRSRKVSEVQ